jgi:flagellar basal body-associated protein FliL
MVNGRPKRSQDRSGLYVFASLASSIAMLALLIHWRSADPRALSWRSPAQKSAPGQAPVGPVVSLPKVIVRVHAAETDVFLHAAFDLEVTSERDKEAVGRQMPRLRDATIAVLSELGSDELQGGADAMRKTKGRLLARFKQVLPDRRLEALYVRSYLSVAAQQ